eukprot:gnl/TRDRNA2_/TRDRNA2_57522_c0_seq1.p2 gnl/TRDRNA2_/TRDRNA2_57522_c0~~gnl/TRDRNA2_/TRDRNA2_57522_c0_seq1.p2  ORF type:complete len:139 (-),score=22.27 gnl/TRDRNA2_/TRDRNA2_57522_c0_seq1:95-511(-)
MCKEKARRRTRDPSFFGWKQYRQTIREALARGRLRRLQPLFSALRSHREPVVPSSRARTQLLRRCLNRLRANAMQQRIAIREDKAANSAVHECFQQLAVMPRVRRCFKQMAAAPVVRQCFEQMRLNASAARDDRHSAY